MRGRFEHNPVPAWRRPLVALSSCHLVILLALIAGPAAAQAPPGDTIYSKQGNFRIPFQIDPGERRIQQVQLHVSEDQGRNWSQYASALPTEKYFNYQSSRDATYWFTVRTVDQAGRMYPPSLSQAQQILKVCVDTQPPVVDLHPLSAPAGNVSVEWQIRDDNLNLDTLVLEYRVGGQGDWTPLGAERLAASKKVWNPATNASLQVRLRVVDLAGNPGEASTTVAVGNGPPGGGAAAEAPAALGPVAGGNVRFVNNTRISLNYDIKDVGPSKVSVVELWYTQDGRNWQKYNEDTAPRSPYVYTVTVEREGQYGFTLLAKSGVGLGDAPPRAGDSPQVWVEVDLTKPVVQLRGVEVGRGSDTGNLTITWLASDKNLGTQPITLSYAERPEGPWTPIASNLHNSGRYMWRMPPEVPYRFLVRVEAADKAGNIGNAESDPAKPVIVDLSQPKIQVLGVESAK